MPEDEPDHDAEMKFRIPPTDGKPHGPDRLISWGWTDGRRTVTPTEHEEIRRLTKEAEERVDMDNLEGGTVVANIWMNDDETVDTVEWIVEESD